MPCAADQPYSTIFICCSFIRPPCTSNSEREAGGQPCAGINRHVVGGERALQERSSDSILTSSLAWTPSRGGWRSVDRGIDGLGDGASKTLDSGADPLA